MTAETIPLLSLPWRMKMSLDVAGISVGEMAERMGVDRNTIGNWINGRIVPRSAFLRVWADECQVDLRWLTEGIVVVTAEGLAGLLASFDVEEAVEFEVCLGRLTGGKGEASITMLPPRPRLVAVTGTTPAPGDNEPTVTYASARVDFSGEAGQAA